MTVPLFKFRQCKDYSEQSKPYFKPFTFAWQRCVLQREYLDFACLYFHGVLGLLWDLKSPKVALSRLKSSKVALSRLKSL